MKRTLAAFAVAGFVMALAAGASAEGVLATDMGSPLDVVKTRKAFMHAIRVNYAGLEDQLYGSGGPCAAVNARSLAALAMGLPPLFAKAHESVYPVEGSQTYFKPGDPAAFEAAADELLRGAAQAQAALDKNDKDGAMAGFDRIDGSCGNCHKTFRGKY